MLIPSWTTALALLAEGSARNPGPWVAHSQQVADAAHRLARRLHGLDAEAGRVLGLLHDIGRRAGVTGMRHTLDGYRYLSALGYEDAARICLTHSFPTRNAAEIFGVWDTSADELAFIEAYLARVELDDYDRLIQLCDALAMPHGFVLMEKRMLDVALRYGTNAHSVAKWRRTFEIKRDFEQRLGCSVYALLPGVVENTFA